MIVKLSSSLQAFQVISEDGTIFQTSVISLVKLVEEGNAGNFLLLTELPFKAAANRFPKSPVYQGRTSLNLDAYDARLRAKDSLSNAHKEKRETEKLVSDSVVDWNE